MTDGQLTTIDNRTLPAEMVGTLRARLPRPVVSYIEWKAHEREVGMPVHPTEREPTALEVRQAQDVLAPLVAPLDPAETVALLTKIRLMTARRSGEAEDQDAQLMLYADELSQWPAEAVRDVLSSQHKHSKWWPTWVEMEERLQLYAGDLMRWRREVANLMGERA